MRAVRGLGAAALAVLLTAGCAAEGLAPGAARPVSRSPGTGNPAADDLLRYSEYMVALTEIHGCWAEVVEQVANAYVPLLRIILPTSQRDTEIATARKAVDEAAREYPVCMARHNALAMPEIVDARRRDTLLRLRAMEDESNAQLQTQIDIARIQVNFAAAGGMPTVNDTMGRLMQTRTAIARTEIRYREARASAEGASAVMSYNQTRIHGLQAVIAVLEHSAQFGRQDAALLASGLREVASQRSSLVKAREEMGTMQREFANLPVQTRAAAQTFLSDMRAVYDVEDELSRAMEDYFKAPDRAKVSGILSLTGKLKQTQDKAIRNVPDMLKRMMGLSATA